MMKAGDMKRAKELLAANCAKVDPFAVEYIDWDAFEGVLEAVMMAGGDQEAILRVFTASINKARMLRAQDKPIGPTN